MISLNMAGPPPVLLHAFTNLKNIGRKLPFSKIRSVKVVHSEERRKKLVDMNRETALVPFMRLSTVVCNMSCYRCVMIYIYFNLQSMCTLIKRNFLYLYPFYKDYASEISSTWSLSEWHGCYLLRYFQCGVPRFNMWDEAKSHSIHIYTLQLYIYIITTLYTNTIYFGFSLGCVYCEESIKLYCFLLAQSSVIIDIWNKDNYFLSLIREKCLIRFSDEFTCILEDKVIPSAHKT